MDDKPFTCEERRKRKRTRSQVARAVETHRKKTARKATNTMAMRATPRQETSDERAELKATNAAAMRVPRATSFSESVRQGDLNCNINDHLNYCTATHGCADSSTADAAEQCTLGVSEQYAAAKGIQYVAVSRRCGVRSATWGCEVESPSDASHCCHPSADFCVLEACRFDI